jgi:TatD DNase family protein
VIDTHAHLDPADVAGVLERARAAGVTRVIAVATTVAQAPETLALAERHDEVFAAIGVHPHEAGSPGDLDELRRLLDHPKAVAVGETGLDYFRDHAPHDAQRQLFQLQLELAGEAGKPVVIHTRAADEDTLRALADYDGTVILHCFSLPALLGAALERRWYVSFAGNVTFPKAPELREAAAQVPLDRILAETDSPYLSPQPVRGARNEPANVMHTLAVLADARGEDVAALAAQIDANATEAFRL